MRVKNNDKLNDSFIPNFLDVNLVPNLLFVRQIRFKHGREFSLFAVMFLMEFGILERLSRI